MFSTRFSFFFSSVVLLCALFAGTAHATTMETLTFEELTYVADLVVEAVVQSTAVERVEGSEYLRTVTSLRLSHVLKGDAMEGDEIDVLVLGGRLGSEETHLESAPVFAPDERVLVFLEHRKGEWRVVGLSQGKLTLVEEEDTARDVIVRVQPPRGLLRFEESAVLLPARRQYADDLVSEIAADTQNGAVPAYRRIPGLPATKDAQFRADAKAAGQWIDPRWLTLPDSKGGQR